uniref:Uncharacterized protein n=1 Tax=Knipowitschia caucasica TaxID=637954 RepID=A0AAV2K547_KNICA
MQLPFELAFLTTTEKRALGVSAPRRATVLLRPALREDKSAPSGSSTHRQDRGSSSISPVQEQEWVNDEEKAGDQEEVVISERAAGKQKGVFHGCSGFGLMFDRVCVCESIL